MHGLIKYKNILLEILHPLGRSIPPMCYFMSKIPLSKRQLAVKWLNEKIVVLV